MIFFRHSLKDAAVVVAVTTGAGVFALPYLFYQSGLLVGAAYLSVFSAVVIMCHLLYSITLERTDGVGNSQDFEGKAGVNLAELAGYFLGRWAHIGALASIALGLLLSLVVYIILGNVFIQLVFPVDTPLGAFVFWLICSLPLLIRERRMLFLEVVGGVCLVAGICFIFFSAFFTAPGDGSFAPAPLADFSNAFLPLGAILFSLAGWTAIEPIVASRKNAAGRKSASGKRVRYVGLALGTVISAFLYALFVFGILNSTASVAPDTISSLGGWPFWKIVILAFFGLIALWTSYVPVALEVKKSLSGICRARPKSVLWLVLFAPMALFALGLSNFSKVIGLAGGVFLSMQYLFIVLVGIRALAIRGAQRFFLYVVAASFIVAAILEVYYFFGG